MTSDVFAKIGTIQGESTDVKHKNEIDVLAWSWGVMQSGSMAYGGAGGTRQARASTTSPSPITSTRPRRC